MKRTRLGIEPLEDRTVPALFGVPWADPRHLTISFVPDGTRIAGHRSNLFAALSSQQPVAVWQRQILKAVQTWAAAANISVGVVPDGGQPLGAAGQTQGDPRFGDIRIAAQAMRPSALAISVPHDPFLSGSLAGDVFINSAVRFGPGANNLFGVMLHEFGHALGLPENDDPTSAMFEGPGRPVTSLSAGDVAAVQRLYGGRPPDVHEGSNGNDTFDRATQLQFPGGGSSDEQGATPVIAFGDVTTPQDVDVFSVKALKDGGPMTFRVLTAGISLLEPRLTVYDAAGNVVGQSASTNLFGDAVSVTLSSPTPDATYFVKVEGADGSVLGTGRYGLAVSDDARATVSTSQIDAVLRGPFDTLQPSDLDKVFTDPANVLLHTDLPAHASLDKALTLQNSGGEQANLHFELVDHLQTGAAYYQVRAPQHVSGPVVMTVAVEALAVNGVLPRVRVFNQAGQAVPLQLLVNDDGTTTVQALNLTPGGRYFVALTARPADAGNDGNFSMVVDFRQSRQLVQPFVRGALTPAAPVKSTPFYVAQEQLFHFVLSAGAAAAPAGAGVRMSVVDAAGRVVFDQTSPVGDAVSGSVLLTPGAYRVRFSEVLPAGSGPVAMNFFVSGAALSDPIGPVTVDPRSRPLYINPKNPHNFRYPPGVITIYPFLWVHRVL